MPINAEQQCERRKAKDRGPVELRPGKRVIQPLLHRLRSEHRNLRVYRLDRVANHGEAIFGAAVDSGHESGKEAARRAGGNE